jgi:hypothetical protein
MTYLSTTQFTTRTALPMPVVANELNRQFEIKTYENDLKRLDKELTQLTIQHGLLVKWDMQGLKAYDHDKRRAVELEILELLRRERALKTQIAVLEGAQ